MSYFDIGHQPYIYDDEQNAAILKRVCEKCYLPANQILLDLIQQYRGQFKIAFSLTGTVIEQLMLFSPETLNSFRRLVDTGCVEILGETHNHSLSSIFSPDSFIDEVKAHRTLIQQEFNVATSVFRNTELIFNNAIAALVRKFGFRGILAEGFHTVLQGRSPNHVYTIRNCTDFKVLLRHYTLSDDIAFRFSNQLTAKDFSNWLHAIHDAQVINLYMDYETFGEHHWHESGIFGFLKELPSEIGGRFQFATPSEIMKEEEPLGELDVPQLTSWADTERDVSAWTGNDLQKDALSHVYGLKGAVMASPHKYHRHTWQSLLNSDHFYYMCTKWHADGDVHKYFNPYNDPYEAYINYQNVVKNLARLL